MKKIISVIILFILLITTTLSAVAAEVGTPKICTILVGLEKREIALTELPAEPYFENGVPMVPLRAIAEALGYKVSWDSDTGNITVDDGYIQAVTLHGDSDSAVFAGHLKVIDMSRESTLELPLNIIDGTSYLPASFFEDFFNEVIIENEKISIAPQIATID